jgi:hypothetical protein
MKKLVILLLTCCCFTTLLTAQNTVPAFINIKGKVVDTANTTLPMATIMLLNTVDNKLMYFTHTDNEGLFILNNIKNNSYVLKVTFLSFYPFQQTLQPTDLKTNDLGVIKIKPIAQVLTEVVIKAAQAPITFHGDTIEYNAASFKVPPGSSVEDLLRRLPGVNVDIEGKISTQGKSVNTVLVNGNRFFGDNPLIATKNLNAEAVSKVQVYDEKSQMEKLTGIKDADKEKVVNLKLKKEYSNSAFGKITVGVGSKERWKANGNYNRFNDKWQLSFVGSGNNLNQTGINNSDYNDFKGKGDYSYRDSEDFGFPLSGAPIIVITPFELTDRRGFVDDYGGGTNYNYLGKKTKFFSSYILNKSEQKFNQFSNRTNFLENNNSYMNVDTSNIVRIVKRHSIDTRFEHEIDSSNNVIAKASINMVNNENKNSLGQLYSSSLNMPLYSVNNSQFTKSNSWNISSLLIYSHRFKRDGQSLSFSGAYNTMKTNNNDAIQDLNQFYTATTYTEQISRLNIIGTTSSEVKSSLFFTQPLFKNGYLETFYNFNNQKSSTNKQVNNALQNNEQIDSLSSYFQSSTLYNRLGSSLHLTTNKINLNIGLAGQLIDLSGKISQIGSDPQSSNFIQKNYFNFVPYAFFIYKASKSYYFNLNYTSGFSMPKINDLSPIPLINNPLFVFHGNPFLKPENENRIDLTCTITSPKSFNQLYISGSFVVYQNQIVYNQSIQKNENSGYKTITSPMNVSGGNKIEGSTSYVVNLWKSKFSIQLRLIGMQGLTSSYVNEILNETKNSSLGEAFYLTLRPSTKLYVNISNALSYNYFTYSINKEQNQYFINHSFQLFGSYQISKKIFFETSSRYTIYRNEHYNINREMPILNASIRKIAGKTNHIEIRLTANDILDKTLSLQQTGMLNYFETRYTPTLSRYFLLSVSYNLKGFVINSK